MAGRGESPSSFLSSWGVSLSEGQEAQAGLAQRPDRLRSAFVGSHTARPDWN